jgi:hypothetical protein
VIGASSENEAGDGGGAVTNVPASVARSPVAFVALTDQ